MTGARTTYDLGFWVNTAERGESFVYGRSTGVEQPDPATMAAARKLADAGLVSLVQRRAGGAIEYVAQRTFQRPEMAKPASGGDRRRVGR